MAFVPAKCTQCGAKLEVDNSNEAAICKYCGMSYVVEKAINKYNSIERTSVLNKSLKETWYSYRDKCISLVERKHYEEAYRFYELLLNLNNYVSDASDIYEMLPVLYECELNCMLSHRMFSNLGFNCGIYDNRIIHMVRTEEEEKRLLTFRKETYTKYKEKYYNEVRKREEERKRRTVLRPDDIEDINEFIGEKRFVGIDKRTGRKISLERNLIDCGTYLINFNLSDARMKAEEYLRSGRMPLDYYTGIKVNFDISFWKIKTIYFFYSYNYRDGSSKHTLPVDADNSGKYMNKKISREFIDEKRWNLIFEYDYKEDEKIMHYIDVLHEV